MIAHFDRIWVAYAANGGRWSHPVGWGFYWTGNGWRWAQLSDPVSVFIGSTTELNFDIQRFKEQGFVIVLD